MMYDKEVKYVFLYILGFGISDLIMDQFKIKTVTKKIVYLSLIFLIYLLL